MPVYKDEAAKKNPWFYQFYTGEINNGIRKRAKRRGFRTKKEAEKAMVEVQNAVYNGKYSASNPVLFGNYLRTWVTNRQDITAETRVLYDSYLRIHILPALGEVNLDKLTPLMIQSFITLLHHKGLAAPTVKRIFSVVNAALHQAVKLDILLSNAASKITKPRVKRKELKIWDVEEVNRFLQHIHRESRYSTAIYLAIMTGMRQGEILGLRWADIDLEKGIIHIQQTLSHDGKTLKPGGKTAGSVRSVAISPETVHELKEWRSFIGQERLSRGDSYEHHDLVICTSRGTPASTRIVYKAWKHLVKKYRMPDMTFHDLRHTHASLLLKQGIHPKIVSERLGHTSIHITMDIYSHLLPNMQEEAAKGLDSLIGMQFTTGSVCDIINRKLY